MISAFVLATALLGQTPALCECEVEVPVVQTWTQRDLWLFEKPFYVEPVYVTRHYYGISYGGVGRGLFATRNRWSPLYETFPRYRYHRYWR